MSAKAILEKLGVKAENKGTCTGPDGWLESGGQMIASYNPSTGEELGKVQAADASTYNQAVAVAHQAFLDWRMVPAPKRGEMVRDLGNALREYKEPLGDLVSLEMGKIQQEG